VSRTNSTPAGRGESEVTATVRHPEILICLSSGGQNALLATKCFQMFCFMHMTHMKPIKFYNFCIKIHDFLRINKEIFYVLSHISSQLNTNIIQVHGLTLQYVLNRKCLWTQGISKSTSLWHTVSAFKRKQTLLTRKLHQNLGKKLVKYHIWSIALYGTETWTLQKIDQ
jgi:hypothetical protein